MSSWYSGRCIQTTLYFILLFILVYTLPKSNPACLESGRLVSGQPNSGPLNFPSLHMATGAGRLRCRGVQRAAAVGHAPPGPPPPHPAGPRHAVLPLRGAVPAGRPAAPISGPGRHQDPRPLLVCSRVLGGPGLVGLDWGAT